MIFYQGIFIDEKILEKPNEVSVTLKRSELKGVFNLVLSGVLMPTLQRIGRRGGDRG